MAEFDAASYFTRRTYAEELSKIQAVQAASQEKTAGLGVMRQAREASIAANAASWVGKLGLSEDSAVGAGVNLAASVYSGLSSHVAGPLAALPKTVESWYNNATLDGADTEAFNRHLQGKATPEDAALLNQKEIAPGEFVSPDQHAAYVAAGAREGGNTKLELFNKAIAARTVSRNIVDSFDRSSTVHQGNRSGLTAALADGSQFALDETKAGWEDLKRGDVASGVGNMVAGVAQLLVHAVGAAASNKMGVAEYVAENAPQLLLGVFGKAGATAQALSNVGYATDFYNQGMENFQAKNNRLPSSEEQSAMALKAASLAAAEQAGDMIGVGAMQGRKAINAVAGSAEKAVGRAGFKESLLGVSKGVLAGAASEAPTEGFQTYMEGEITGKPASALEIYQGAAIGGLSGAALSGSGRAVSEVTQSTPEAAARAQKVVEERTVLKAAIAANDTTTYLDPESKNFDPAKAVQVLHGNSALKDTPEEVKQENLVQARTIVTNFQDTVDDARDAYRFMKQPEGAKQVELAKLKAKIADPANEHVKGILEKQLTTFEGLQGPVSKRDLQTRHAEVGMMVSQLTTARAQQEDLASRIKQVTPEVVKATVDLANATIDPQDMVAVETSQKAVKTLLNLSMSNTSHLTGDKALELADNKGNALTQPQRDYLREFSKARLAENQLMTMGKVSQTIMTGDGKNLGIKDYRITIGQALEASDRKTADKHMEMLKDFASGHQNKATAFQTAFDTVTGYTPIQVIATKNTGEWVQNNGKLLNDAELRANGGANIHKGSVELLSNVKKEASALNQAVTEQNAAYAMVYPTVQGSAAVVPVVAPSATSAPLATASPTPGATVASVAPSVPLKTMATLVPGESVTLYRGETASNDKNGQWWTTDKAYAEQYGKITEVTLPSEVVGEHAAQGHGASTNFVFPTKTPTQLQTELGTSPADTTNAGGKASAAAPTAVVGEAVQETPEEQEENNQAIGVASKSGDALLSSASKERHKVSGDPLNSEHSDAGILLGLLGIQGKQETQTETPSEFEVLSAQKRLLEIHKEVRSNPGALDSFKGELAGLFSWFAKPTTTANPARVERATKGAAKRGRGNVPAHYMLQLAEELNEMVSELAKQSTDSKIDHKELDVQKRALKVLRFWGSTVNKDTGKTNNEMLKDAQNAGVQSATSPLSETNLPKKNVEVGARSEQASEPSLKEEVTAQEEQTVISGSASQVTLDDIIALEKEANAAAQTTEASNGNSSQEASVPGSVEVTATGEQAQSVEAAQGNQDGETRQNGKLAAVGVASEKDTPYKLRKLIGDYFSQKSGNDRDATLRPLVEVKDFLSALISDAGLVVEFVKDKASEIELTDRQANLVSLFKLKATAWNTRFQGSLVKGYITKDGTVKANDAYKFKDLMQFLITEMVDKDGKQVLDLEENLKTAMSFSAFSWIAENAGKSKYNSPEEINAILLRDDTEEVTSTEYAKFGLIGVRENVIRNALGQKAIAALGLSVKSNAPKDLMPKLESAMGAYIQKILMEGKEPILVRTTIPGEQMREMTGNKKTDIKASFQFLKLARDEEGKVLAEAEAIYQANKDTQGILNKLFSVESGLKDPSLEPIPFKQGTTKNTEQGIPSLLAKIIEKENAEANFIRWDMWGLMGMLDEATVLAMAGVKSVDKATTHLMNRGSIQAKNDGLQREYSQFMEYVGAMKDTTVAMFFDHSVWKQQRVGILTNTINPQTSKFHRFMLYRQAWETKVDPADKSPEGMDLMDSFKLRVMEGLGTKTDKQSNETTMTQYEKTVMNPVIQDAVAVLVKTVMQGQDMTAEDQQTLAKAVAQGGSNFHSLDALMALAQESFAKGKPFTVQMMGEVDGVTNGPMLTHLLLGAAGSVKDLFGLLNRGGFYQLGSAYKQYNLWRESLDENGQPRTDLYETTTRHMVQAIRRMVGTSETWELTMKAIYAFTGELTDAVTGNVVKAGRNIIKTPLTAMVFGSSLDTSIGNMANNFIEAVYESIEKLNEKNGDPAALIANLNRLLGKDNEIRSNSTLEELMETEFTREQIEALKNIFQATIGVAVKETMEVDFKTFIDSRKTFNQAAKLSFDLYNAAYMGMRETYITELMDKGEIDFTETNKPTAKNPDNVMVREPNHSLTNQQEKVLQERMEAITPLLNTLMSKESQEPKNGLLIAKTERKLSEQGTYKGSVKFGTPFADGDSTSANTTGYERVQRDPGVAMLPMSMHSTDSYISHMAARLGEVLNVHDAHGAGLATFEQTARNLNEATWNAMLAYSPFEEMQASFSNVVLGIDALLKSGNVPPAVYTNLKEVIKSIPGPKDVPLKDRFFNAASTLVYTAGTADSIKYGALAQMAYVDQYALEGGNYEVTEAQRAEAAAKQKAISWSMSTDLEAAIESIQKQVASAPKVAQTTGFEASTQEDLDTDIEAAPATPFAKIIDTVWGQVGNPTIPSDPALVAMFEAKPVMSAREVVGILQGMLKNGVANNKNLIRTGILERVAKLVPADLKVRYVTPTTAERDVLDKNAEGARGWYVSTVDGKQEIYVLSSDFKQSGLTAELLLHELLHGVLAQTIAAELAAKEANPEYTSDAYLLVQDLETLLGKAQGFVEKNKLSQFKDAVSNVHELVSWGMTNLAFQKEVLNQVTMQSKTRKNALVTGMKEFIQTLTGLLFKGSEKSRQAIAVNGMSVLFSNVSGLLAQAEQNKAKGQATNLSMASGLNNYTTADIHAALSTGAVSDAFDTHLREVISNITEKLQGPFGAFREAISRETVKSQADVFTMALATGVAPFAFKALAGPFRFSNQEAFVAEMVAVTIQTALDSNPGDTSSVYTELRRQFAETRSKLKPSDFDADPVIGKEKYDFIFNRIDKTPEGMSQQLAQFAAMGLAHEGFSNMLKTPSDKAPSILVDRTFLGALRRTFEKALEWFNGKLTHTYAGQPVDSKLVSLVSQLVAIENKKLAMLEKDGRNAFTPVEEGAEKAAEAARKKLAEFGRSKLFKKSKHGIMRGTGAVISIVAEDRIKQIMGAVSKMREEHFEGIQGLGAGVLTYMRGPKQAFGVLLQMRKHVEGKRKSIISETSKGILGSFVNGGQDLSHEAKGSLTAVLLRTGAHVLLGTYDYRELHEIVSDDTKLQAAVKVEENALGQFPNRFRNEFLDQSRVLAYHLATGKVAGQHLLKNADNIARMLGTSLKGRLTEAETLEAAKIIDRLTTLYAIGYLDTQHRDAVAAVMVVENARTDRGNGIEALLKLHKFLDKDSADRLFSGNEALMAKGYTPEIYNPHTGIKVANEFEGAKLIALGYTRIESVLTDPDDIAGDSRHLYAMRDGGLPSWLSGSLSLTGMRATGTKHHSDHAFAQQRALTSAKQAAWMSRANPGQYDPAAVKAQYMAPVFNGAGDAVNYAYLMVDTTKDSVLERDNRFDEIMGVLAGNIYDKESTAEHNQKVIQALHDEYLESYSEDPKGFVVVGPTSSDPELRELYQMLPKVTRDAILAIWGTNGMKVRADMLDINFGYRKLTLSTAFDKAAEDRNEVEKAFTYMVESFLATYGRIMAKSNPGKAAEYADYGKRAGMVMRRTERIWQTLVAETKDNFVVKSGTALLANTTSNMTLLKVWGVSNSEILKYHQVAYKGAEDYQRDNSELMQLEMSLNMDYVTGDVAELTQRIEHLKDALLRNPVRELIEKGLMPSIVEDVSTEEDIYSYKAEFARRTAKFTKRLNNTVIDVGRTVYMAHDTQMYKTLNHLTQLSDFTARYTLYQHLITRKKNPMSVDEAIKEATDSFVNYDIPMHRKMQYSDDMGFTMFTKYFLSIQRILLQRTRENPGRVMMLLSLGNYFDWLPTVMESSFLSHVGNNPINMGALKFPTSLDDLATVNMGLSLFK